MKTLKKNFSLVEVVVVLAVISILASLVMSASRSVREAGKRTTCLNNLKQIQSVIESYRKDHRKAPFSYEENKTADDYFSDFSFAADYISEGDLEVFHCPGDDNTKTMTSLDELSGGSSYLYIPSKSDLQDAGITNPTLAIEQMYLVVYDKHKENHNGNINILYLHGGGNPKGGVASTLKSGEYEWSIEELADNASDSDNDGSDDANDGNNGNDSNDANDGNGNDANDDGNNGHGNNDDGNDDSNPGNNGSNNNNDDANNSDGSDENSDNNDNDDGSEGSNNGNNDGKSNNGHGNNEDGVDSSNPGNSKDGEDSDPNVDDEIKGVDNSANDETSELDEAEDDLEEAKSETEAAEDSMNEAAEDQEAAENAKNDAEDAFDEAKNESDAAEQAEDAANNAKTEAEENLSEKEEALEQAKDALENGPSDYSSDNVTLPDDGKGSVVSVNTDVRVTFELVGSGFSSNSIYSDITVGNEKHYWENNKGKKHTSHVVGKEGLTLDLDVDSGLTIAVNGRSSYYDSNNLQGSNNLVVYRDGDKATNVGGYNGQESVKSFLSEYIDSKGNVTIDDNQVIFLMELGTTNKSRSYFDMQDLVVVATFEVVATQDDVSALEQEVQDAKEALVLATTNANSASESAAQVEQKLNEAQTTLDEASEAFESSKSKFEVAEQAYYDAEDKEVECEKKVNDCKKGNNGWGNGDQDAPGNSLEHNNAENAQDDNSAEIAALESKIEQLTKEYNQALANGKKKKAKNKLAKIDQKKEELSKLQ